MTQHVGATPDSDEDTHDPVWDKRCEAKYRAELSALYHQKRERFFELSDKLTKAASLLGGSTALWKSTGGSVTFFALIVTSASAASLVFSFSDRARRHAELARGFRDIISSIIAKGDHNFDASDADGWLGQVYTLEAKEPPALSALTVLCQNELAIARNEPTYVKPQGLWIRWMAHFFDMPQTA